MAREQWLRASYPGPQAAGRGKDRLGQALAFEPRKPTPSETPPLTTPYLFIFSKQLHLLETQAFQCEPMGTILIQITRVEIMCWGKYRVHVPKQVSTPLSICVYKKDVHHKKI